MIKYLPNKLIIGLWVSLIVSNVAAQNVLIEFEPHDGERFSSSILNWQEGGMVFQTEEGVMLHTDPSKTEPNDHFADNSTPYIRDSFDTTIILTNLNSDPFSIISMSVAEFSDFRAQFPTVINFTGVTNDGEEVFQSVMLDGIFDASGPLDDFETIAFGSEFSNLSSMRIRSGDLGGLTDGFSMDNIQVQILSNFSLTNSYDINFTGAPGSFDHELESGTYSFDSVGINIGGWTDEFTFVYEEVSGDIDVRIRLDDISNAWSASGLILRQDLEWSSAFAGLLVESQNGGSFARRYEAFTPTEYSGVLAVSEGYWLRLHKQGDMISSYISEDGEYWDLIGTDFVILADPFLVGIGGTTVESSPSTRHTFDQLSVEN
ncbi:MAG: hypothetical protein K6L80_12195 [Agarilytica sp.]